MPAPLPPLIVIAGATASGKTAFAMELAERFPVEIVSADSRQVYRRLDIGTAKASAEERRRVPHHLLDVVDPDEEFSVADFVRLARKAVIDITVRGRLPLVVGGTGLYLRALTGGLAKVPAADPELRRELLRLEANEGEGTLHRRLQQVDPAAAARLHPRDRMRIVRALEVQALTGEPLSELQARHAFTERPCRILSLGMEMPREELYRRIDRRVEEMFAAGLLAEVRALLAAGYSPELKSLQTIGYRESLRHLQGEIDLIECMALVQRHTRRYAKRQSTWFRRDKDIIWVDSSRESARIQKLISIFMHE